MSFDWSFQGSVHFKYLLKMWGQKITKSGVLYCMLNWCNSHNTEHKKVWNLCRCWPVWKVFFTTWSRFKDLGLLPVSSSLFYHILLSVQTSAKSLIQPCQILTMYMTLNLTESWIQMTVLGQCAWLINLLYLLYFKNTVPALRPLCSVLVYVQTVQMKTLASLSAYDDSMTVHAVWNMKPCIFYFLVKNLTLIYLHCSDWSNTFTIALGRWLPVAACGRLLHFMRIPCSVATWKPPKNMSVMSLQMIWFSMWNPGVLVAFWKIHLFRQMLCLSELLEVHLLWFSSVWRRGKEEGSGLGGHGGEEMWR